MEPEISITVKVLQFLNFVFFCVDKCLLYNLSLFLYKWISVFWTLHNYSDNTGKAFSSSWLLKAEEEQEGSSIFDWKICQYVLL